MNYLQKIAEGLPKLEDNTLFTLKEGELTSFQADAIKNITKLLLKFGELSDEISTTQYRRFIEGEYSKFNIVKASVIKNKREVNYYSNEASFWMATGSGKTYVISKLIDNLLFLMKEGLIPLKQIMVLAPSNVILEQIKATASKVCTQNFNFMDLKKHSEDLFDVVYFYNGTNIANENQVAKKGKGERIDYKDFGNNWYVILDEAHKGSSNEGVRREYYQYFGERGLIFNFSATLTEKCDINSTVYNYNLSRFIQDGFGKQIAVMKSEHKDFNNGDYLTVLKSIILFTAIKRNKTENEYHNPLCLGLVDTVSASDSNLITFFNAILQFKEFEQNFKRAKSELRLELNNVKYQFTGEKTVEVDLSFEFDEVLRLFYNADKGAEEVVYVVDIKANEVAIRLNNSTKFFALVNIGDVKNFVKMLENYTKEEAVIKNFFKDINSEKSTINLLLGSRVFVEGWDSNRPNIINLVNIGSGKAKQYVMQVIGRGVRVEPTKGKRKRIGNSVLESLFVFSTEQKGVEAVLNSLNIETSGEIAVLLENTFFKNEDIKMKLYLPVFKSTKKTDEKFILPKGNFEEVQSYVNAFSKKHLIAKLIKERLEVKNLDILNNVQNYLNQKDISKNTLNAKNNLFQLFQFQIRDAFDFTETLEECSQINHFNNIKMKLSGNYITKEKEIKDFIKTIKNKEEFIAFQNILKEKKDKSSDEKLIIKYSFAEYLKEEQSYKDFFNIYHNLNYHYYNPFVIQNNGSEVNFINVIKSDGSEAEFLRNTKFDFLDEKYTWCFARNEVGEFYIPYELNNKFEKFYPDFIFWLQPKNNNNKQIIVFIDPKGLKQGQDETRAKALGFEKFLLNTICYKGIDFEFKLGFYNQGETNDEIINQYRFYNFKNYLSTVLIN